MWLPFMTLNNICMNTLHENFKISGVGKENIERKKKTSFPLMIFIWTVAIYNFSNSLLSFFQLDVV